jgi:hypothetical protein
MPSMERRVFEENGDGSKRTGCGIQDHGSISERLLSTGWWTSAIRLVLQGRLAFTVLLAREGICCAQA